MDSYNEVMNQINRQDDWRKDCVNMIASENIVSLSVNKAICSDFGHRYAEGILGGRDETGARVFDRFYQGTKIFDEVESLAMSLSEKIFNSEHANVVPISGAVANLTVYHALARYGDTISGLSIPCGGHISHTHISSAGVMGLKEIPYAFDKDEMNIDVDKTIKIIAEKKPRIIILGCSLFLFPHPVKELRTIADETDAVIMYDAAHVLGLIAGKKFQKPLKEGADVMTASTHKTFPGPQGGIVLCKEKFKEKIDNAAFPGLMSNHHLHHVAGFSVALAEMEKFGENYADQIIKNSKALAQALYELGLNVLCEPKGFTQSHQVVVDVSDLGGGEKIANDLEDANIIINKNLLPWDTLEKTGNPSGIRIGTQELTHVGMKEDEMKEIAQLIKKIAVDGKSPQKIREDVIELKKGFNRIHYCFD